MTIGELKAKLAGLPDDLVVTIQNYGTDAARYIPTVVGQVIVPEHRTYIMLSVEAGVPA